MSTLSLVLALILAPAGAAADAVAEEDDAGLDPTLPVPTLEIDRIPPTTSYELALQMSYGTVSYWSAYVPSWIGFGLRAGWGRNFGIHRLGADGVVFLEGPIGVHMTAGIEPQLSYNMVNSHGLLLGAGAGPALLWHSAAGQSQYRPGVSEFGLAPSVAARVGWSQTWSRVGRRLFVFLEPKLRVVDGKPNPLVAFAVGSGLGR